jgi:hypothetical protein
VPAVNANGTAQTFNNNYSAFRTWLLGVSPRPNMAYMLSAQLAASELDVAYKESTAAISTSIARV